MAGVLTFSKSPSGHDINVFLFFLVLCAPRCTYSPTPPHTADVLIKKRTIDLSNDCIRRPRHKNRVRKRNLRERAHLLFSHFIHADVLSKMNNLAEPARVKWACRAPEMRQNGAHMCGRASFFFIFAPWLLPSLLMYR